MDLYDDLASNNEEVRIKAAEALVNRILQGERTGIPEKGTDLLYALNRLVKGLSSGRESARLGFSIALTELLHELPTVDVAEVLQLLENHTTPSGNISGMEERDFYFGRLFGLNVLVESEIIYRPSTSSETITRVLNGFFELASKKTWLREPTAKAISTLIISLPRFQNPISVSKYVQQKLNDSGLLHSQDGAAILLTLHTLPKELRPHTDKIWHHADPLHASNLSLLTKVLKESSGEDDTVKHTGNFKGEAHFVWMFILRRYMEKATDIIPFEKLWKAVVESPPNFRSHLTVDGFFSSTSSLERKYRGFQLFNLFLPQLPAELVKCLFTDSFMRSLVNHSSSGDRYLNKAAKKTFSIIRSTCEARPDITATVYESLVTYSPKFDRLTKSKTIEELYSLLPATQISSIISFLTTKILSKTAAEGEKKWYMDQILLILRQPSRQHDTISQGLGFFCRQAFFSSTLTKSEQTVLREKLFSLLANLIGDKDEVWPTTAVMMVEKVEDEGIKKVVKFDSEIKKIRKAGLKTMKKLRSQRIKTQSQSQRGLEMLYALTLLQLYAGDSEAVAVLQDLQSFYEMTLTREEGHVEILVEIVLGFLSKNSALQRRLGEQVFGSFVGELTPKALEMLLDVLLTPETVAGAGSLFETGDEEMGSSEEDEDDEDDEEDEEDEEENEGEDMEMDIDNQADEELDAALSAALGTSKPTTNGASDAESTSDEELMNDDEMMALDDSLATIFRQRLHQTPTQKKENQDKKEQIVIFKSKVIDLLDIVIKHPSPLHLDLILPLLQVLRVTKNDIVHSKTITLLNKLAKNKFLPDATDGLMGLLRKVHEDAAKSRAKDGNVHSHLSVYIARIARKAGIEEEVVGVYAETMRKWIKNGKNNIRAGLFTDWVNWCQSIRR